jgi:cyanophycinase-like exopeptidase
MKKYFYTIFVIGIFFTGFMFPQSKGHLVIIGGVQTHQIIERFVELAGGCNAKIIVIPNAGSEPVRWSNEQVNEFKELGANADYLLFTR